MHSYRTNHTQPVHYANYTMFVAEVASTVNENLLIEQLLQKETDPAQRMALLNQYMEGSRVQSTDRQCLRNLKRKHMLLQSVVNP